MILHGDCLEKLKEIPDNSVDAVVTDPPAGISFMNKSWDSDKGGRDQWVAWLTEVMTECLRVLKPGAHSLVWAIPRTSHWTATAIENAGFEVRDIITHHFGSGFPKSHNIEKATGNSKFAGLGTALKPASEHWILARKPLSESTVAKNVLKWGCGGINIDGCRVDGTPRTTHTNGNIQGTAPQPMDWGNKLDNSKVVVAGAQGRFPANLILDEAAGQMLDEQSGHLKSGHLKPVTSKKQNQVFGEYAQANINEFTPNQGGASRFFYCAKASKSERNAGLEGMLEKESGVKNDSGRGFSKGDPYKKVWNQNHHPTVKPLKLMQYLITLITPTNGIVLDPFAGSGSTLVAAKNLGFKFIGIEREAEYIEIIKGRLNERHQVQAVQATMEFVESSPKI